MCSGSLLLKGIYFEQVKKGALIFSTPDWNELLPRGLPFLLCYAFALDSAVQEEIVALATLFE